MAHGIRLLVSGDYACFTRPEMKVERFSYDVMTPSAGRGILEAIHWKPAIKWIIEEIRVLKPIRFQSIRRNELGANYKSPRAKIPAGPVKEAMKSGDLSSLSIDIETFRQQRAATVLADVAYVISARFELTPKADDSDNPGKHLDTFNRRARKGQCFHQPCLGTREFPARFQLIEPEAPMPVSEKETADLGFGAPRDLGFMLFDTDHAGDGSSMLFRATLDRGVMKRTRRALPTILRSSRRAAQCFCRGRAGICARRPATRFSGDPPMSALSALARAYDRMVSRHEVPAFGYSTQNIRFLISLNADGSVAGAPVDLRSAEGKKLIARRLAVPQPVKRTSGIAPNFLWDKTAYVLCVTAGEGKRSAAEHKAFVERHRDWLAGSTDEGLVALLRFLEEWRPQRFSELAWPEDMKDQNVVFGLERERLDSIYIHDRPAARELWARLSAESDKNTQAVCLVTGKKAPVARLHPSIKGVWGRGAQPSGASIISFNLDAFMSYGHEQGDNAPVSEAAAFAYTTALNHFLRGSGHRIQIGDTSTVFWAEAANSKAAEDAEYFFASLIGFDDEKITNRGVKDTLEKIRAGRAVADIVADLPTGVRFYILGLAANASRLSIRFYLEDEFGAITRRYLEHVERLRIEPPPRETAPSMWRLLIETAVLRKSDRIQPNLAGDWLRAILSGTPYPLTLLSTLIMRLRADGHVNALRVAMLKSILIRNFNMEAPVALDPSCRDQGYLLGRLFALYEQVQTAALGRAVNATIKDKYYGAASAQPRRVFHLLQAGSANHLSKIGKKKPGLKVHFEKQIGGIMEMMDPGTDPFPVSLPDKSQALFGLGYYHQSFRPTLPKGASSKEEETAA
jgi:CRISPR-associated protein Csd1